jgi:hypothetical protein
MRTYPGTDKRDPDAIQKIDAYLKDASVAIGSIEKTLPDHPATWYKGEPGEPGEPGDPGEPGTSIGTMSVVGTFTPSSSGPLPLGIARGNRQRIFYSCSGQLVMSEKYSGVYGAEFPIGNYGTGYGQYVNPVSLCAESPAGDVDEATYVWVLDMSTRYITKFKVYYGPLDHLVWETVSRRTPTTPLSFPKGIALNGIDHYFVSDSGNHRIRMFEKDFGTEYVNWGTYGTGNGQFNGPTGLAADVNGYVYVADTGNHRIQKFLISSVSYPYDTATYVTKWGSLGSGVSEFNTPMGVSLDQHGNVYVADMYNGRIQKFTSDGVFIEKLEIATPTGVGTSGPRSIDFSGAGAALVLCGLGEHQASDGWINEVTTDVVTITGEEIVSGEKTFNASPYIRVTGTENLLKVCAGTAGTCTLMPGTMMTTVPNLGAGDVVIGSAPNVMSALPSSGKHEGDVLTISGGTPAWEPPATRLVEQNHPGETSSITSTVLVSKAPAGVYSMYVKVYGLSGSGNVTVSSEWDGGRSTEELVSNFAL